MKDVRWKQNEDLKPDKNYVKYLTRQENNIKDETRQKIDFKDKTKKLLAQHKWCNEMKTMTKTIMM